ncbi:hypothetical protein DD904_12920, partial [Staphylococcus pseudintermedius]
DVLSESLVDVLVDLLNDADSLSATVVGFDALSESLVDVPGGFLNDAAVLSDPDVDVHVDALSVALLAWVLRWRRERLGVDA